jgi:nucleoside-diphosphate-sugar epimerase
MKSVFITGGLGFIGQSILGSSFEKVTVYDISLDSFRKNCEEYKNVHFVQGDILDSKKLEESMKGHDIVIHLAAYMSSSPSLEHYIKGANININGTLNLIHSMNKNNITKLIFFSSSFVYGNTPENENGNKENDSKNPHTGYGITKLTCENILRLSENIDYVIMRPSIVCGKYDWYGQSISVFIKQAIVNGEIKVYKGAENISRDYVYSQDVGKFINITIEKNLFRKKIYNLSSHEKITTLDLVYRISRMTGAKVVIEEKGNDSILKTLHLDNSEASKLYSFKKLDEYLEKYIEWATENHTVYW